MRNNLNRILFYILIVVLQIIVNDYVNFGLYIYICFLPLLILYIPLNKSTPTTMIFAFALGLLIDVLSDGILGLNASASVVLAAIKKPLFSITINKDNYESINIPTIKEVGISKYLKYTSASIFVFLLVYIFFDCISVRPFSFVVAKLVLSVIANVIAVLIISYSLLINKR